MNCPQHHLTFSFLKIFKVASDEADPPLPLFLIHSHSSASFWAKTFISGICKTPTKTFPAAIKLSLMDRYPGNIFRLILLLQTVPLSRAMSLHRQPDEEQEEIFSTILSSFSSLAATSTSFSSCFPEHSEINSYFPALLLLKVRRGTWLRKGCAEPPTELHFGIRCFLSRSTVNELWNCFHSAITSPPCQTLSLGRLRGISVQNHRLLWTLIFASFNLVNYWLTAKIAKVSILGSRFSLFLSRLENC